MYGSIQICRALAALMVVCFHVGGNLHKENYFGRDADSLSVFFFGDAGVPFFFVLSGFIVTWAHFQDFNHPKKLGQYLVKRAARIYPSYWIVFLAVYAVAYTTPSWRETLPADAATLLRSLLLLPQDKDVVGGVGAPVLFVAWTLQYEIIFYAAIGLGIIRQWLLAIPAAFFLINFFFNVFDSIGFYQEYLSNIRIFLFGMGVLVAYAAKSSRRIPRPLLLAWGGALGFATLAIAENIYGKDWGPIDHIIAYGIFSSSLVLGLIKHEDGGNRISTSSFMAKIGDASYSLYLLHVPIMSVLCKIAVLSGMSGPLGAWVAEIFIVSTCTLVAMAFHARIERPIMRAINTHISPRPSHWAAGSKPLTSG